MPSAGEAFVEWLRARADLAAFEGRPYPVFIVASQGGGSYATAHAVQFLRRAQATCDRFNMHLFAISGVSGGSLGGAFVSAMASRYSKNAADVVCPAAPLSFSETSSRTRLGVAMASEDFLAPLTAGALFPDMMQRIVPYPIESWSRARAIEKAFEAAWGAAHRRTGFAPGENPMEQGVVALWSAQDAAPAVLFNTTEVETGRRMVISPFRFESAAGDLGVFPLSNDQDIALSTAASLSARFPWAAPAGWFMDRDLEDPTQLRRVQLVDGGYFENSGVSTALDLIEAIETAHAADPALPEIEIFLIVLTNEEISWRDSFGYGELLEPLRALISVRSARTPIEIARAEQRLGEAKAGGPRLRRANVEALLTPLPIGWRLSVATRLQIAIQGGDASRCPAERARMFDPDAPRPLRADCVLRLIYETLR